MRDRIVEELCTLVVRALMEQKTVDIPSLGLFEVKHTIEQPPTPSDNINVRSIPEDTIVFTAYPTDVNK